MISFYESLFSFRFFTEDISISIYIDSDCVDTDCWENGYDHDCNSYATQWCENGAANTGSEWTLGSTYNYPENNCCVCGKGNTQGNVPRFYNYKDQTPNFYTGLKLYTSE